MPASKTKGKYAGNTPNTLISANTPRSEAKFCFKFAIYCQFCHDEAVFFSMFLLYLEIVHEMIQAAIPIYESIHLNWKKSDVAIQAEWLM